MCNIVLKNTCQGLFGKVFNLKEIIFLKMKIVILLYLFNLWIKFKKTYSHIKHLLINDFKKGIKTKVRIFRKNAESGQDD